MDRSLFNLLVLLATILVVYLAALVVLYFTDNLQRELSFRIAALVLIVISLVYYLWAKDR